MDLQEVHRVELIIPSYTLEPLEARALLEMLPLELWLEIFSLLPLESLSKFSLVSKKFYGMYK
jgi:hypothetical protein